MWGWQKQYSRNLVAVVQGQCARSEKSAKLSLYMTLAAVQAGAPPRFLLVVQAPAPDPRWFCELPAIF